VTDLSTSGSLRPIIGIGESQADFRARALQLQQKAAEQRSDAIREQSSLSHTPQERIRLWETLHGVQLPRKADHVVLTVVAADTGLTLEQVHAEQRQRFPADGKG
jgi:hypothetical protein